jgi:type III restriction enzyme
LAFVDNPIINSPFERPKWHFELEDNGQPTGKKLAERRRSIYVVPVPAARRRGPQQRELSLEDKVTENVLVNEIRRHVDQWRELASGA